MTTIERIAKWIIEKSSTPLDDIELLLIEFEKNNPESFNENWGFLDLTNKE